jgi:integrase/recombinase XerC
MADADVARHLQHLQVERRLAARTLALYGDALARLEHDAAALPVALREVQVHHVRRWAAQLHAGGASARSIALVLSAWRGFYRWLGREGQVACNPVDGVRAPKAARPLPKALAVDHAVALAEQHDEGADPALEARDRCIVELLYGCGLRVSELTGLDAHAGKEALGWVDLDAAEANVLGKGGKRRGVPVGSKALEALRAWLAVREQGHAAPAAALFIGRTGQRMSAQAVWKLLRLRSAKAGLAAPVHPHMLRHSFASHVLQSSSDLRAVQELLGHANIATTQVYTRLDFQHLARAYDAAHPRARLKSEKTHK